MRVLALLLLSAALAACDGSQNGFDVVDAGNAPDVQASAAEAPYVGTWIYDRTDADGHRITTLEFRSNRTMRVEILVTDNSCAADTPVGGISMERTWRVLPSGDLGLDDVSRCVNLPRQCPSMRSLPQCSGYDTGFVVRGTIDDGAGMMTVAPPVDTGVHSLDGVYTRQP